MEGRAVRGSRLWATLRDLAAWRPRFWLAPRPSPVCHRPHSSGGPRRLDGNRFVWRYLGRKLGLLGFASLVLTTIPLRASAFTGTYTGGSLNLCMPNVDSSDWGDCYNYDMGVLSSSYPAVASLQSSVATATASLRTDLTAEVARATTREDLIGNSTGTIQTSLTATQATIVTNFGSVATSTAAIAVATTAFAVKASSGTNADITTLTALTNISSVITAPLEVRGANFINSNWSTTLQPQFLAING